MKPSTYEQYDSCPFYTPYNYSCTSQNFLWGRELAGSNSVAVRAESIVHNNSLIKEKLQIPILYGNTEQGVLNTLNNNFRNDVMEFKSQMEEAAKENAEEARRQGKPVIPYIISNSYDFSYNRNKMISLSIIYSEKINNETSYIRVPYNYDLSKGRPLALKDIFNSGVDYKKSINKKILKNMKVNPKAYLPYTDKNFKGIVDVQPFYLDGNNLVVFLGLSGIASAVDKIPAVKIPFSELGSEMKAGF